MTQKVKTKKFIDPDSLLDHVPVEPGMIVADLGCGNGYFSVSAAAKTGNKGKVYAVDIQEEALSQTSTLAKLNRLQNVYTKHCDLEKFGGCDIPDTTVDLVIMVNLLHQVENIDETLKEAYRIMKTGAKLLVVEWKKDAVFGPSADERIGKDEAEQSLERNSFRPLNGIDAGSFHYALVYQK